MTVLQMPVISHRASIVRVPSRATTSNRFCLRARPPGAKTLGEGNQSSLDLLERLHAAFRSAQGYYALRSGDDGDREHPCGTRFHSSSRTEVGEEVCPGSKDGAGVGEKSIVAVGSDRNRDNRASGGQAGVVQQTSPEGEEVLDDSRCGFSTGGFHRRSSSFAGQIQRGVEQFGLPARKVVIDGPTRRAGGLEHFGE